MIKKYIGCILSICCIINLVSCSKDTDNDYIESSDVITTMPTIVTQMATANKPAVDNVKGFDVVPYANVLTPMGENVLNTGVENPKQLLSTNIDALNRDILKCGIGVYCSNDSGAYAYNYMFNIEIDDNNDYCSTELHTSNNYFRTLRSGLYCWIEDIDNEKFCKCTQAEYIGPESILSMIKSYLKCNIKSNNVVTFANKDYNRIVVETIIEDFGENVEESYRDVYLYFDEQGSLKYLVTVMPDYVYAMSIDISNPDSITINDVSDSYEEIDYEDLTSIIQELHFLL